MLQHLDGLDNKRGRTLLSNYFDRLVGMVGRGCALRLDLWEQSTRSLSAPFPLPGAPKPLPNRPRFAPLTCSRLSPKAAQMAAGHSRQGKSDPPLFGGPNGDARQTFRLD